MAEFGQGHNTEGGEHYWRSMAAVATGKRCWRYVVAVLPIAFVFAVEMILVPAAMREAAVMAVATV